MKFNFKKYLFLSSLLSICFTSCNSKDSLSIGEEQNTPTQSTTSNTNPTTNNNTQNNNADQLINKRILDSNGNFGGTYDEEKYGLGTPLNGENDIENSPYFLSPDVYNLKSSQTRVIYEKYQAYQKTMFNSDGIACLVMLLNRDGYDVSKYNELYLYEKYQEINNTSIKDNNITATGLKNLLDTFGYNSTINEFARPSGYPIGGYDKAAVSENYVNFVKQKIKENNTVLVKIKHGQYYNWKMIIGVDTMKSATPKDDTFIIADPNDILDHKQDGYTIINSIHLVSFFMNINLLNPSSSVEAFQSVVVENKKLNSFKAKYEEYKVIQEVPELHLLKNSFGSYYPEKTRASKFGIFSELGAELDSYNSIYYKFNDVYNFEDTDTRIVCTNFSPFLQTWSTSCGFASGKQVFSYYGFNQEESSSNIYSEWGIRTMYNKYVGDPSAGSNTGGQVKMYKNGYKYDMPLTSGDITNSSYSYIVTSSNINSLPFKNDFVSFKNKFQSVLKEDTPIIVASLAQSVNGHYTVCIGYDDMGTENIYDDVMIFGDPSDQCWDHYRDGYNVCNAVFFFYRWYGFPNYTCLQSFYYFRNPLNS